MSRATRHAAAAAASRSVQRIRAQQQAARDAARARDADAMTDQTRIARIQVYALQDGAVVPGDLAELAWMLCIGTCTAMSTHGPQITLTRRIHAALRTIHAMALAGCRWRAAQAAGVEIALSEANDVVRDHPRTASHYRPDADWLAHRIQTQTTEPGDVAGPELYRSATP